MCLGTHGLVQLLSLQLLQDRKRLSDSSTGAAHCGKDASIHASQLHNPHFTMTPIRMSMEEQAAVQHVMLTWLLAMLCFWISLS